MLGLACARYDDSQPTAASFGVGGVAIFARAANDNGAYDYAPPTANVTYAATNALNQYPSVGGYAYNYWPESDPTDRSNAQNLCRYCHMETHKNGEQTSSPNPQQPPLPPAPTPAPLLPPLVER